MRNKEFLEYLGVLGKSKNYKHIENSDIEIKDTFLKMKRVGGFTDEELLNILDKMLRLEYSIENIEYVYKYWKKIRSVLEGITWAHEIYRLHEVIDISDNETLSYHLNDHIPRLKGVLKFKLGEELYTIIKECILMSNVHTIINVVYIAYDYENDTCELVKKIGTKSRDIHLIKSLGISESVFDHDKYLKDSKRLKIWIK